MLTSKEGLIFAVNPVYMKMFVVYISNWSVANILIKLWKIYFFSFLAVGSPFIKIMSR
jgi:hypothetical protein